MFALIQWHPRLGGIWCGVLFLAVGAWTWFIYRRMVRRVGQGRANWLLAPKLIVLLLLLIALLDPVSAIQKYDAARGKLLAVIDTSTSMDVADDYHQARAVRAREIVARWRKALPTGIQVDELEFDTSVRKAGGTPKAGVRETDLGGCLVSLAERGDISSYLGVALLTDGGDEAIEPVALPKVPLSVVAVGADPTGWNDLALADMQCPQTAEKDVDFEILADLAARAGHGQGFAAKLARVRVTLERETATNAWEKVSEQSVDLSNLRARVKLPAKSGQVGVQRYRVAVEPLNGELSTLNNSRVVVVNIQKKALRVLYFSRDLGQEFKVLRNELGRDPGISFTALFRTAGDRFTLQGDRVAGDDALLRGFPEDKKGLETYDVIVIGSFPAEDCSPRQTEAMVQFVEAGGTAIFLGGDRSFGRGGYAQTSLAVLFPWRVSGSEPEPEHGTFPVRVPPMGIGNPILATVEEAVAQGGATIDTVNVVSDLKPGATPLLGAQVGPRDLPLVALQPFGKGKVMAIASNTLWRWATQPEPLRSAYGLFWRQAVRVLTGKVEGGQNLAVRWDKDFYRPGEQAVAELRVLGSGVGAPRFNARLTRLRTYGESNAAQTATPAVVEPVPGQPQTFSLKLRFRERGEYGLRLTAYQGERVLETYEKDFLVAPLVAEGSRLEVDEAFLKLIATRGGGVYLREAEADGLAARFTKQHTRRLTVQESSIVEAGPWFAGVFLGLLVIEWIVRRKMGLF